jgi:hypothetical protein
MVISLVVGKAPPVAGNSMMNLVRQGEGQRHAPHSIEQVDIRVVYGEVHEENPRAALNPKVILDVRISEI